MLFRSVFVISEIIWYFANQEFEKARDELKENFESDSIFLEIYEQNVTSLDDDGISEDALFGSDTESHLPFADETKPNVQPSLKSEQT